MTKGHATVDARACGSCVQPTVSSPTAPSLYVNPCPFERRETSSPSPCPFERRETSSPPPCHFERSEKSSPPPLSFRASREIYLTTPPYHGQRCLASLDMPRKWMACSAHPTMTTPGYPLSFRASRESYRTTPPPCPFERREKSISRHCHTTVKDVSLRSTCQESGWHAAPIPL
jgi:hypothetical protein